MAHEGWSATVPAPAVHFEAVQSSSPGEEKCGVVIERAKFAVASYRRIADIGAIMSAQAAFRYP